MPARSRDSREAEFRRPPRPSHGGPTPNVEEPALLELQRTVGNAAVAKLLADRAQPSAPPGANLRPAALRGARVGRGTMTALPVQRTAVVNEQSLTADDPGLTTDKMVEWVKDQWWRKYESMNEFEQHAAESTDYLGNMSSGQWVRFSRTGINVLGERHTSVTLPDVIKAVSGRTPPRYLYEPFSTDDFSQEPHTEAAYRAGLGAVRDKFGEGEDFDWRPHALESLYPKLGETMSALLGYMESGKLNEISEGQEGSYFGKISSRFLKIAWAYGKDVQNHAEPKPAREKLAKKRDKPASTWDAVMHSARHLDSFIDALPGDANLADHLLGRQGKRYQDPVRSYVKALVGELLERGAAGAAPGNGGQGSLASREQAFRGQREAAMAESVRRSNGIRYVGVGNNHLEALAARLRQEPGEFHFYGLTDEGLYERPLL